eukprot:2806475-Prorocentrum_lima.AAC.1
MEMVDEDAKLVVTLLVRAGKNFNSISSSCAMTLTSPVIVLTNIITSNICCGLLRDGSDTLSHHVRI